MKYSVEVPLGNDAVARLPNDGSGYEPSDAVTEWLDELTGHYWFYEVWHFWKNGHMGYQGLRFFLPSEEIQLMFKLAWGGK